MFETCINEVAHSAVRAPLPVIQNIDLKFVHSDRIISDDSRLRSDLKLAKAVQRQMLPRNTKQLTTITYAGTSSAAWGIGGDYYDFLDLGHSLLGFLLGDVSGKGVAAALLMANLQASVRCECARGFDDLGSTIQRVNAHFYASTLPAQYATLFFGRYDDRTRRLDYINCSQQPAIIQRGDRSIERLETTALPLGMVRDWAGEKKTVHLQRGDSLFVCSDGVIEAGLENGYEFGEEGLISVIAANSDQDVELAVERIAHAARLYVPNGPADDMTIAGMRAV
ncbi:MAG TPA: SpoIIE family protein phosphatase [Bryobacteraceae bacterium]|nr:SpoIIE family protein phosphatase [Bryobacteraceae bacterium]